MAISKAAKKLPVLGQKIPDKNVNGIWARKYVQEMTAAGTNGAKTFGGIFRAPCRDFTHVRVYFGNLEATPGTISDLIVANTASSTDPVVPTVGNTLTNNATSGWVRGTFSGSNTVTLPAAGADVNNPGILCSDWIPLNSITPSDGSLTPYFMARVKFSTTNFSYILSATDPSVVTNTLVGYQETYRTTVDGNACVDPTLMTNTTNKTPSTATPFYGFEFISSKICIKGMVCGDSISAGKHAANTSGVQLLHSGWWQQAQDLITAQSLPIGLFQSAVGGMTTAQYSVFSKTNMTLHSPSIAFYSVNSPNDNPNGAFQGGIGQNLMNTQYQRALDFANVCRSNGVLPIFTFLAPNNNYSAGDDTIFKGLIARCKAASILVIDLSPVISTTGNPRQFITASPAINDDSVHPNAAGYALMAASFVSQLTAIINANFALS